MPSEPVQRFLDEIGNFKQTGNSYTACCPAHDDSNPSLSIGEGDDGRVLLTCHSQGCTAESICEALKLELSDLFCKSNGHTSAATLATLPKAIPPAKQVIEATYSYRDATGNLIFEVVRYKPKKFRQRRSKNVWHLRDIDVRPLYRLPQLLAAGPESFVYICEGEKDCDNLDAQGLVATTNSGGASKLSKTDWTPLENRNVVIIPDNDKAGRKHADDLARKLNGNAKSLRILTLPDLPDKGDVSDWLDAGNDAEDLQRLAEGTSMWSITDLENVADDSGIRAAPRGMDRARIEYVLASELGSGEQLDWIWHGWLAKNHITLMVGMWKAGKTTLLSHLLKTMGNGGQLAGIVKPCKVLVITEEGSGLWAGRRDELDIGDNATFVIRPFKCKPSNKEWEAFVEEIAEKVKIQEFDLIVIDPWQSMNPCRDENESAATMRALLPLHHITEAGSAVLLMHHPKKGESDLYQGSRGSGALTGFVDIIINFSHHNVQQADDHRRVLKGVGRFDETPSEVVIELTDSGYRTVGSKGEATQEDRIEAISAILNDDFRDVDSILAEWPDGGITKPGKRTLQRDLTYGVEQELWERDGQGKRGSPLRYKAKCVSRTPPPLSTGIESEQETGTTYFEH